MALIIREVRAIRRDRFRRAPASMALVGAFPAAMLLTAVALSLPLLGVIFAGTFVVGALLATVEHRPLMPGEALLLGTLHLAALVLFAL